MRHPFLLAEILRTSFVSQLIDGSLPKTQFLHFAKNDFLYLKQYLHIIALLQKKTVNPSQRHLLSSLYEGTEMECQKLSEIVTMSSHEREQLAQPLEHYLSFLMSVAIKNNVSDSIAVLTPCIAIYTHIASLVLVNTENVYRDWAVRAHAPDTLKLMREELEFSFPKQENLKKSAQFELQFFKELSRVNNGNDEARYQKNSKAESLCAKHY